MSYSVGLWTLLQVLVETAGNIVERVVYLSIELRERVYVAQVNLPCRSTVYRLSDVGVIRAFSWMHSYCRYRQASGAPEAGEFAQDRGVRVSRKSVSAL